MTTTVSSLTGCLAVVAAMLAAPVAIAAPTAVAGTVIPPPTVTRLEARVGPTSGAGAIGIAGTEFRHVTQVRFGRVVSPMVDRADAQLLWAKVPAHSAATVHVRVVTESGTSPKTDADTFTYYEPQPAGQTWAPPSLVDPAQGPLHVVSCASSTFCVAADWAGTVITWDGNTWSPPVDLELPTAGDAVTALSCPTDTFCAAGTFWGHLLTYDGNTWTDTGQAGSSMWSSVSCGSSQFCLAVNTAGDVSTYDGNNWSAPTTVRSSNVRDVSCPSDTFCLAVTPTSYLTYDGAHWSTKTTLPGEVDQVSCTSSTFCMGADRYSARKYNGTGWSGPKYSSASLIESLACADTTCRLVDDYGLAYTWSSGAWSAGERIVRKADSGPADISCPTTSFCMAVDGFDGLIVRYAGGWTPAQQVLAVQGDPGALDCPTADFCVLVDQQGAVLTFDGSTWSAPTDIGLPRGPTASVSCPTVDFCMASIGGATSTYDGVNWSTPVHVNADISALSCPVDGICTAVDNEGKAVRYVDGAWGSPRQVTSGVHTALVAVSCPVRGYCFALSDSATGYEYDTGSWQRAPAPGLGAPHNSIACPARDRCLAIGGGGYGTTMTAKYNGQRWTRSLPPTDGKLTAIDCSSFTACVAGTATGEVLVYDGTHWSLPLQVDASRYISAVATTGDRWAAVDTEGYATVAPPP